MICTNCGQPIDNNARFCTYCGTPTADSSAAPRQPEPAASKKRTFWNSFHLSSRQKKDHPQPVMTPPETISPQMTRDIPVNRSPEETDERILLQSLDDPSMVFAVSLSSPISIGRDAEENDIVMSMDRSISRKHCLLYRQEGVCYVQDLNSQNHTFLNGVEIEQSAPLYTGDILRIGTQELVVKGGASENRSSVLPHPGRKIVFCANCGKKYINGETFCIVCGSPLGSDRSNKSPHDSRGAAAAGYCISCGKPYRHGDHYCTECGTKLTE